MAFVMITVTIILIPTAIVFQTSSINSRYSMYLIVNDIISANY